MAKTIASANDEPCAVLSFWRDTEIFNIPQAPKLKDNRNGLSIQYLRPGGPLPWFEGHCGTLVSPTADQEWVHAVYVGDPDPRLG